MKQHRKYLSAVALSVALVSTVGCASTSKHEGTAQHIDDSTITTKVKATMFDEPTLKVSEINVETNKGVVQLSGFVSSPVAAKRAVAVTRSVGGVKAVKNDMLLK